MAPNEGKYQHDCEGPDDMPAHIKSALSGVSLNIPISKGHLLMGTWQGVWLMEYRTKKHAREIIATITGRKFNQS
jgi:secondary thiamine-phosphate synthase enzyme